MVTGGSVIDRVAGNDLANRVCKDIDMRLDINGLDKVTLLRALYDRAQAQGCSHLSLEPGPLSSDEARRLFEANGGAFSFIKGRLLKVDLSGTEIDVSAYDRNNGWGAAVAAIRSKFPGCAGPDLC